MCSREIRLSFVGLCINDEVLLGVTEALHHH
jgi:hypothetical protein